ncbi:MAG: hypothetical protein HC938_09230 [Nitrospira sp.]|nr:hypothetical protein [Nitrospira sp.]
MKDQEDDRPDRYDPSAPVSLNAADGINVQKDRMADDRSRPPFRVRSRGRTKNRPPAATYAAQTPVPTATNRRYDREARTYRHSKEAMKDQEDDRPDPLRSARTG